MHMTSLRLTMSAVITKAPTSTGAPKAITLMSIATTITAGRRRSD